MGVLKIWAYYARLHGAGHHGPRRPSHQPTPSREGGSERASSFFKGFRVYGFRGPGFTIAFGEDSVSEGSGRVQGAFLPLLCCSAELCISGVVSRRL